MNNYIRDKAKRNMFPVSKEDPKKDVNESIRAAAGRGTEERAGASTKDSAENYEDDE